MPSPPRKLKKAKPRVVFVDTSGWIAFFSQDGRNHAQGVAGAAATRIRFQTGGHFDVRLGYGTAFGIR